MSLPGLLRDRNSGIRQARLEIYGRNRFLQEYRSYHADCVRIDAEALPAGLAFHPTAPQDVLLVADDKGKTSPFSFTISSETFKALLGSSTQISSTTTSAEFFSINGGHTDQQFPTPSGPVMALEFSSRPLITRSVIGRGNSWFPLSSLPSALAL